MFNKSLLKIIFIFSLIIGAIDGLIPIIPIFMKIAFLLIMFGAAPVTIIYFRKLNLLKDINTAQSLLLGAITGGAGALGFCCVFLPIAFIINLIFKTDTYLWVKIVFSNFGYLVFMVTFLAMLSALLNMFSAFLTVYIYEYFNQTGKK